MNQKHTFRQDLSNVQYEIGVFVLQSVHIEVNSVQVCCIVNEELPQDHVPDPNPAFVFYLDAEGLVQSAEQYHQNTTVLYQISNDTIHLQILHLNDGLQLSSIHIAVLDTRIHTEKEKKPFPQNIILDCGGIPCTAHVL